jgi:hypothetical protein
MHETRPALASAVVALLLLGGGLHGQAIQSPRAVSGPVVVAPLKYDRSPALRDLPPRPASVDRVPHAPLPLRRSRPALHVADPVAQTSPAVPAIPGPIINFDGVAGTGLFLPPDTNGDIGPNHYVQWVNTSYAVYSRTGTLLYGPAAGNTLWTGFGAPCEGQNDGDPIVLYDSLADRWVMSQLALPNNFIGILLAPFYQCIAVSQTPDPMGAYFRYVYQFNDLNDYPKFGVWPDAYYMTMNQFASLVLTWAGQGVVAYDRARMLAGQPANMIYFNLFGVDPNLGGMLPADLDGPPPPAGSPGLFAQIDDDGQGAPADRIQIWRFHADWTTPSASTFTGPFVVGVAPFDSDMCAFARSCIPQPGTAPRLDALADRLMYRLQYRNFGTHQSLVVNHTVDVDGSDHAGVRWYEIRNPGGTPVVHQQGTYAPDASHRWMGSAALDRFGNLAVAFNVSSATTSPSIRYAARLAGDPPGVLAQGESDLMIGSGSQGSTSSRWGDYSMLGIDPVDDCTFWATAEYYASSSTAGWQTRVGAFRLPGCGSAPTPPAAPINLVATAVSQTRIDLTWSDQSNNEDGFQVERCSGVCTSAGPFTPIAATGAGVSSYSDTGLTGGATYSYRVRAYAGTLQSGYSNIAPATTVAQPPPPATAPAAPSNLTARLKGSTAELAWVDNSSDETRFEVQRSTGGSFLTIATLAANTTKFSDLSVPRRTTYTYRVSACNAAGCSQPSNTASVTRK